MAEPRKYWSIQNKGPKSGEVLIYEQIGAGFFEDGIGAAAFAQELKDLGDIDSLSIRINSPGGSVFEGQAIYSQLKNHKAEKTVYIDGLAASIASVIAMAGDRIVMPRNATMMIHDPWSMAVGNAEEMRKQADALDVVKKGIVAAYAEKTKMADKDIEELMADETWMSAEDALGWGFVDEVDAPAKMAASAFDLAKYKFKNTPQSLSNAAGQAAAPKPKEKTTMAKCKKHPGTDEIAGECPSCNAENLAQASAKQARENEIARAKALRIIGKEFDCMALAEHGVENGWSEDTLRVEIMSRAKDKANREKAGIDLTGARVSPAHEGKPFRSLGEQLVAVAAAGRGDQFAAKKLGEIYNASGNSEAVPSDGGFLVQSDFTTALLDRANETSMLYNRCRKIQVTGNGIVAPVIDETTRATGSRWGGVQVYRVNEAATATAKKPKFGSIEMKLEKLMGIGYATEELLADSSALEGVLSQSFVEEMGFKLDDEIMNGTGAGQMLGILNANALVSVDKEGGQLAATVVADNVIKMYSRMPARNKRNAIWIYNGELMPQIMKLNMTLGTAGFPMFTPPGGLSGAPYGTLFGKEMVEIEQAAALGTIGDLAFVDLSQYLVIEKGGLNASRSLEVRFLYDEQTFKWTTRNNGQPIWKSALTPYKGSATVSPFVALATRA